jgi:hypothetical protein
MSLQTAARFGGLGTYQHIQGVMGMKNFALALAIVGALCGQAAADLVFTDFNASEGKFGYAPTFSGTSVGEAASSTADRVTTDTPFEGAGHQKLVLNSDGTATLLRIRHLSGGPPNDTPNAGSPAGNVGFSFTTSGGMDGWIGYYLRTTVAGMETQLNLDGPANSGPQMRGSTPMPIIADGQWHLYEWNLDASVWGSVPGIVTHATGALPNNTYTLDSIYFRDPSGTPSPSGTYFLDFVALNSDGSVALLVAPVPEAGAFAAMGLFGLISAGAVWIRKRRAAQAA